MSISSPSIISFLAMMLVHLAASILVGCKSGQDDSGEPQTVRVGTYHPVTAGMLVGTKSSQRTGGQEYSFVWTFTKTAFRIEGASIPPDLSRALAGDDGPSRSIGGTWWISGEKIVLTNRANGKEASMRLFKSGPGIFRIENPEAQYVFSRP